MMNTFPAVTLPTLTAFFPAFKNLVFVEAVFPASTHPLLAACHTAWLDAVNPIVAEVNSRVVLYSLFSFNLLMSSCVTDGLNNNTVFSTPVSIPQYKAYDKTVPAPSSPAPFANFQTLLGFLETFPAAFSFSTNFFTAGSVSTLVSTGVSLIVVFACFRASGLLSSRILSRTDSFGVSFFPVARALTVSGGRK